MIPESVRIWICPFVSALFLGLSFFFREDFPFDPAWGAVLLCGVPILKEAAEGLVKRFDIKADLLVATALLAALWIGEVFAAGEVALIMILGERLEERTVAKARSGIEKLLKMMPRTARKLTAEGERIIPASELRPGDLLRVLGQKTLLRQRADMPFLLGADGFACHNEYIGCLMGHGIPQIIHPGNHELPSLSLLSVPYGQIITAHQI